MTNFVLIHGGAHGAWCWDRLVPLLKVDPRVDVVEAIDLVGHGARVDERLDFNKITIDDYVDEIADTIESMDLRNVVIVGHSLAGCSIPQAAARVSNRVRRLVFLSALIPDDGLSAQETQQRAPGGVAVEARFRDMFCTDMDNGTAEWHMSKVHREPREAMRTKIQRPPLPETIAMTYIYLLRDEALTVDRQRRFAATLGITDTPEIDTGHSAMVTRPVELAEVLLRYA